MKSKIMTIVGTRPEIIKLSRIINELDKYADHILVHTGQNYDYELNEIFFKDLNLIVPLNPINFFLLVLYAQSWRQATHIDRISQSLLIIGICFRLLVTYIQHNVE